MRKSRRASTGKELNSSAASLLTSSNRSFGTGLIFSGDVVESLIRSLFRERSRNGMSSKNSSRFNSGFVLS